MLEYGCGCVVAAEGSDGAVQTSSHEPHSVKDVNVHKIRDRANVSFLLSFCASGLAMHMAPFLFISHFYRIACNAHAV